MNRKHKPSDVVWCFLFDLWSLVIPAVPVTWQNLDVILLCNTAFIFISSDSMIISVMENHFILGVIVCDGCNCLEPWESHLHLFIQHSFSRHVLLQIYNYTSETEINPVIQKCYLALSSLTQVPNNGSVVVLGFDLINLWSLMQSLNSWDITACWVCSCFWFSFPLVTHKDGKFRAELSKLTIIGRTRHDEFWLVELWDAYPYIKGTKWMNVASVLEPRLLNSSLTSLSNRDLARRKDERCPFFPPVVGSLHFQKQALLLSACAWRG